MIAFSQMARRLHPGCSNQPAINAAACIAFRTQNQTRTTTAIGPEDCADSAAPAYMSEKEQLPDKTAIRVTGSINYEAAVLVERCLTTNACTSTIADACRASAVRRTSPDRLLSFQHRQRCPRWPTSAYRPLGRFRSGAVVWVTSTCLRRAAESGRTSPPRETKVDEGLHALTPLRRLNYASTATGRRIYGSMPEITGPV